MLESFDVDCLLYYDIKGNPYLSVFFNSKNKSMKSKPSFEYIKNSMDRLASLYGMKKAKYGTSSPYKEGWGPVRHQLWKDPTTPAIPPLNRIIGIQTISTSQAPSSTRTRVPRSTSEWSSTCARTPCEIGTRSTSTTSSFASTSCGIPSASPRSRRSAWPLSFCRRIMAPSIRRATRATTSSPTGAYRRAALPASTSATCASICPLCTPRTLAWRHRRLSSASCATPAPNPPTTTCTCARPSIEAPTPPGSPSGWASAPRDWSSTR